MARSCAGSEVAWRSSADAGIRAAPYECAGNPCKNGGRCTNGQNSYACACVPGFSGANCEVNIDDCASRPCQNGGVCTDGVASYSCACATGFTGASCEVNINDCAGNPCQNGGACSDGVASYSCACAPGFSGANCEVNIDDCASRPCQNGGVCVDGVNQYSCNCAAGFSGANCEVNINDCASAPCQNGGACHDGIASYSCACAAGYSGTNCEINIDDCASHPCQNGGTCVDEVNAYLCSCAPGFSGTNCQINNDDCSPNHCQNGGICIDGVNSYTCNCASNYTGTNCETVIDPCAGTMTPDPAHRWTFNDGTAADGIGGANGTLLGGATISGGQLIVDNTASAPGQSAAGQRMQAAIPDTFGAKTLVTWVSLADLSQHGGSALTLESTTTNAFAQRFDTIDYAERTATQWMSGSDNFSRSPANNNGAAETSTSTVMVAIVYGSDNSITLYHNGVPYSAGYAQGSLQTYTGGASDALIGLRHSGCGSNCWLSGAIDEARIYPVALNACQIKTLTPVASPPPSCPTGSLTLDGKCYMHVKTPRLTQPDAEVACQASFAGHLASFHSAAQKHALSQYVDPNGMAFALQGPGYGYNQPQTADYVAWIGGVGTTVPFTYSATGPGTGAWTDGSTWDYSSWRRNYIGVSEPTDSGNVNGACLMFVPDTNIASPYYQQGYGDPSGWNDANCSGLGSYLCEFNP